jgi:hypothetical protein
MHQNKQHTANISTGVCLVPVQKSCHFMEIVLACASHVLSSRMCCIREHGSQAILAQLALHRGSPVCDFIKSRIVLATRVATLATARGANSPLNTRESRRVR